MDYLDQTLPETEEALTDEENTQTSSSAAASSPKENPQDFL